MQQSLLASSQAHIVKYNLSLVVGNQGQIELRHHLPATQDLGFRVGMSGVYFCIKGC